METIAIDPALCERPVSQWIVVKVWLMQFLSTPLRAIPVLLLLALLPWGLRGLKSWWREGLRIVAVLPLVLYVVLPLPPVLHLAERGLTALLPSDSGRDVDAIVILGRGGAFRRSRVELAQQLWESKRAPRIFTSGRGDASAMREGLARRGVPIVALGAEDCSQTTDENARFTAAELQPQGIRSILLVTDGPHMMRSLLTFRSLGFSVSPHPSPIPEVLSPAREALVVLQEYAGLLAYGVRGRYWPGRTPDLDSSLAMHLALDSQSALLVER